MSNEARMRNAGDWLVRVVHATLKETAFIIHKNIVLGTPVDTGRARSSWNLSENSPDRSQTPPLANNVNPISGAVIERATPGASPLTPLQASVAALSSQQQIGPRP